MNKEEEFLKEKNLFYELGDKRYMVVRYMREYAQQVSREIAKEAWFEGMKQGVITDHNDRNETNNKRISFDEWIKNQQ